MRTSAFSRFALTLLAPLLAATVFAQALHDGSQHHGVGIQPTVPASHTLEGVAAGCDELLEKAIEVVDP